MVERVTTLPLRALADRCGLSIGAACTPQLIETDPRYAETLASEFNTLVAENCMKFAALQPARGQYSFADADALAAFARAHAMRLRGHTLVWHHAVPAGSAPVG